MKTYKIYFASGDPLRTYSDEGDLSLPRPGKEIFTAAEAAEIVRIHEWAWIDKDGDIIVNRYRTRCGATQYKPVKGYQMAARLRAGRA